MNKYKIVLILIQFKYENIIHPSKELPRLLKLVMSREREFQCEPEPLASHRLQSLSSVTQILEDIVQTNDSHYDLVSRFLSKYDNLYNVLQASHSQTINYSSNHSLYLPTSSPTTPPLLSHSIQILSYHLPPLYAFSFN